MKQQNKRRRISKEKGVAAVSTAKSDLKKSASTTPRQNHTEKDHEASEDVNKVTSIAQDKSKDSTDQQQVGDEKNLSRQQRKRRSKKKKQGKKEILNKLQQDKQIKKRKREDDGEDDEEYESSGNGVEKTKGLFLDFNEVDEMVKEVEDAHKQELNFKNRKKTQNEEQKRKTVLQEIQQLKSIFQHPLFQSNPVQTIQQHLENKMKLEASQLIIRPNHAKKPVSSAGESMQMEQ